MRRILIVGLLSLSATVAFARNGTVQTRDGRTIEGDITLKDREVVITTKAGSITYLLTDVASINYTTNIKEQYEERLAALPNAAGAKSHIDLARWLYDNKEYALARTELEKALEKDPNNSDAAALKQAVERSMIWDRAKQKSATTLPAAAEPALRVTPRERRVLDAEQINAIRQGELRETDRVRIRMDGDLRQRYLRHANNVDPAKFAIQPDGQKALEIMEKGTPDMRRDLRILSDPAVLMRFKTRIQPILLNGCATNNCHGGTSAGSFQLYNPADNEAITYTNFYILTQYNPQVGQVVRKSLDRQQPAGSLILQYGLPREQAQLPHPQVQGLTLLFRGPRDPKYLEVMDWIQSLVPLTPEYGITFQLPGGSPTTQPAAGQQSPAEKPEPQPDRKPADDRQHNEKGSGTDDTLKEIRERIRPIRGL